MGMPAARITDMHVCPMVTGIVPHVGGPIITGAPTVITGSMPQARITDTCVCVGPPDIIVMGAFTVIVCGMPAARIGDMTAHGGAIVTGFPTVIIGDAGGGGGGGGGGAPGSGEGQVVALAALASGEAMAALGELATTANGMSAPAAQAVTLKEAASAGTPFCAKCAAAALAASRR